MSPVQYRLSLLTRITLYTVATLADIIQIILLLLVIGTIINTVVSVIYYLIFGSICLLNSVKLFGTRQLKKTVGTWFAEAVPILNFLPWFLIGTYLTIRQADQEDREKANPAPANPTNRIPVKLKMIGREIIKKVAIVLLCLLPVSSVLADSNIITTPDLTIRITPRDPGPATQTTIDLTSYSFDLERSQVNWQIDGKKILNNNDSHLSLTTGKIGVPVIVKAQIIPVNSSTKTVTISIIPTQVDLIWRGDTYTPPGYLGGKPISLESVGQVTALPILIDRTKRQLPPTELVYNWSDDGKTMTLSSGLGKDTYTFKAPIGGTKEITVSVENRDGSLRANNTILIPITKPRLLFYEESALTGPNYAQALQTNFTLTKNQSIIRVVPYFFPQNLVIDGGLNYNWFLNGEMIGNNRPSLGVENSRSTGVANLEVHINNPDSLFQSAKMLLGVTLGDLSDNF
ncbi:MAG: hypothetical protein HYV76_02950 [Candidatus Vogelbacteria bacterium]|nr:hypothetical protein [Candidatus Vogelbacteria bacterium]